MPTRTSRRSPPAELQRQAVKAGILREGQGTFVPAFYVEPAILAHRDTLDFVGSAYLSHKNWYLWWGLGGQNLTGRSRATVQAVADMQRECAYVMQGRPRLERAPKQVTAQPLKLTIGTP
ncbi:hypothetical protein ACFU3E_26570 [Streptomyces sp. NPDC057424]|uniref:hypothetical protein n=1 Tax=Streptomyces sp. NPDC057424 TaxID=3346127 RepID=UPI0036A52252